MVYIEPEAAAPTKGPASVDVEAAYSEPGMSDDSRNMASPSQARLYLEVNQTPLVQHLQHQAPRLLMDPLLTQHLKDNA